MASSQLFVLLVLCHYHRFHRRHWHHGAYTLYSKWRFTRTITHSNLTAVIIIRYFVSTAVSACVFFLLFHKTRWIRKGKIVIHNAHFNKNSMVFITNTFSKRFHINNNFCSCVYHVFSYIVLLFGFTNDENIFIRSYEYYTSKFHIISSMIMMPLYHHHSFGI